MTVTHNSHRTHVAFFEESTAGTVPANAAAWASAEGTTAFRMFVEQADPAFIRGEMAVPNADMQTRVGEAQPPHHGLPTADGGSIVMRLTGSGESFVTGDTVTESALGRLLKHALGGQSLGNHATVTVVTSQLIIEVDDAADMAVGQVLGVRKAATPTRVFPTVISALDGVEITLAWQVGLTIEVGDEIIGAETYYYDQAALTNPEDANASTLSILIQKGPVCWVAGGAHLSLDSIAFEMGQQPKLTFGVLAAQGYPPGATGSISGVPSWTGTIQGQADVRAIGRDTHFRMQSTATETFSESSLFSFALQVGCPVLAQDGVTEAQTGMPGRIGYRTEPAETLATVVFERLDAQQTAWETPSARFNVAYWQTAPIGRCWCVIMRDSFYNAPPTPQTADVNKNEVVVRASDTTSGATELANSKILIALL